MADIAHRSLPASRQGIFRQADRLGERWPAIAAVIGLVALWQFVVWALSVPTYMMPSPGAVLNAFRQDGWTLWTNLWPTLGEALLGFLFGNLSAILLAVWFVHNRTAERAFYPIAVFMHTIPIIAVAPILVLIFGNGWPPRSSSRR